MSRRWLIGTTAAALLLICGAVRPGETVECVPGGFQAGPRSAAEERAEDIDFLVRELPKRHKNLYFRLTRDEFNARAEELKNALPAITADEFLVGLSRLIASVGDSHTTVGWRPQRAFPLLLYWFKEGICVLNIPKGSEKALYGKLVAVDGRPIEDVMAAFAEVIPHENEMQLRHLLP